MLDENCVACHREGGIGPWAMSDYNMVRGFSLMIREVVRTKRMPPWHADPAHGDFSNDRSLTPEQTQTLVTGSKLVHLEAKDRIRWRQSIMTGAPGQSQNRSSVSPIT